MASFKDLITVANDPSFQNRVIYALECAAIAVMSEDSSTNGHANRVNYANKIIQNAFNSASIASMGVVTNLAIASEADMTKSTNGDYGISDGDIQYVVNEFFNAFAGVAR